MSRRLSRSCLVVLGFSAWLGTALFLCMEFLPAPLAPEQPQLPVRVASSPQPGNAGATLAADVQGPGSLHDAGESSH